MNIPITRYQRGGDIYQQLASQYGTAAADAIAAAATTNDRAVLAEAIALVRSGPARTGTSTLGNFFNQLITDPLAAPLESANNQIGKAVWNVVKNPWVLATLVGVISFVLVGGIPGLKKMFSK